ncbi:MAG: hypothetical protein QXF52_09235 [Thermoproteota archaeon]
MRRIRLVLLTGILLAYAVATTIGDGNVAEYSFPNVNILEEDLFVMALNPTVENIQMYVQTREGKGYSSLVITNGSLEIPVLTGRVSMVQFITESPITNLTVTFNSNSTVKMLYGVLTSNYSYYKQVSSDYYTFSNGIFVILPPQMTMPPGASKITFILNTISMQNDEGGFKIELPPLATVLPSALVIVLLVYLNAYIVVDSYHVSIREELSRARKLGIIIFLGLSALIIYWLVGTIFRF